MVGRLSPLRRREARRGKTRVDLDLRRLDSFGRQLDRTLDRASTAPPSANHRGTRG